MRNGLWDNYWQGRNLQFIIFWFTGDRDTEKGNGLDKSVDACLHRVWLKTYFSNFDVCHFCRWNAEFVWDSWREILTKLKRIHK